MALAVFEEGPASLDPQKALYIPVGAASPLWFLFAGAASAGVAYWWITRWADRTNLEALLAPVSGRSTGLPAPAADAVPPEPVAALAETAAVAGAMVEQVVQAGADVAAATLEAIVPPHMEAAPETVAEIAPEAIVSPAPAAAVAASSETAAKPRAKARPADDPASDA